jgi:hypothetical protein
MAQEWSSEKYYPKRYKGTTDSGRGSTFLDTHVLDDDREFEDFVARVPGFSSRPPSRTSPSIMLSLMHDRTSQPDEFDPILGSCINDLLKTCVPGTSPLTEESRKSRLRVCMRTLWYFAKEYNQSKHTTPLPSYVRAIFATPEMTDWIQSEEDLAARLIGRCFHSLIVKKLVWAIDSCDPRGQLPSGEELSCLAGLLGKTTSEVTDSLGQPGAIELANIVSLASSLVWTRILWLEKECHRKYGSYSKHRLKFSSRTTFF